MTRPFVGVQVAVLDHGAILLGRRENAFGAGTWGLPGGHLEFGESIEAAAARELREETGLEAESLEFARILNTPYEDTHYVQLAVRVLSYQGTPRIKEPANCSALDFFKADALPTPLFPPSAPLIEYFLSNGQQHSASAEQRLSLFMMSSDEVKSTRYVHYLVASSDSTVLTGSWGPRAGQAARASVLRQFESIQQCLSHLRRLISERILDGFDLYSCGGNLPLDDVVHLFPAAYPITLQHVEAMDIQTSFGDTGQLALFELDSE